MYGARCRCVAGQGECCSHVAGVLFQLEDLLSQGLHTIPDDQSCTGRLCSWIAPANAAQVTAKPLETVYVYKPVLGKLKPDEPVDTVEQFHPVPLSHIAAAKSRASELCAVMHSACPTSTFVTMYDAQQYCNTTLSEVPGQPNEALAHIGFCVMTPSREVEVASSAENCVNFSSPEEASTSAFLMLHGLVDISLSKEEAEKSFVQDICVGDESSVKEVEADTRGQTINYKWFYHRIGQVTSSKSHWIGHLRDTTSPSLVLDSLLGCSNRCAQKPDFIAPVHGKALFHGQKMEPVASGEYIQAMKANGSPVTVATCGLL